MKDIIMAFQAMNHRKRRNEDMCIFDKNLGRILTLRDVHVLRDEPGMMKVLTVEYAFWIIIPAAFPVLLIDFTTELLSHTTENSDTIERYKQVVKEWYANNPGY